MSNFTHLPTVASKTFTTLGQLLETTMRDVLNITLSPENVTTSGSLTNATFIEHVKGLAHNVSACHDCEPPNESSATARFEVPFLITVCIVGLIGNVLVCIVYSQKQNRRSNACYYILNLAIGDLLAIFVVVFHITEFFKETWPLLWRSDWACIILRYLRFVGFNVTIFTMVAIAIDRYFAICHPMKFKFKFTNKRTKLSILAIWSVAFVAAIPTAFMFQAIYQSNDQGVTYTGKSPFACKLVMPFGDWFRDFKALYLNIVLFYVPVSITSIAYAVIVHKIWKSTRMISRRGHFTNYSHWKAARMLLIVFVTYVLSYVLLCTYNLVSRYFPDYFMDPVIKNVGLILPYANSCMNPLIYSFVNPKFRYACYCLICCRPVKQAMLEESLRALASIRSFRSDDLSIQRDDVRTQADDANTQIDDKGMGVINNAMDLELEDKGEIASFSNINIVKQL